MTELTDFVHRSLRSELFKHSGGGVIRTYGHAVWTVAHLGYKNNLELWVFADEQMAVRVAALVAALRGREEDLEAL